MDAQFLYCYITTHRFHLIISQVILRQFLSALQFVFLAKTIVCTFVGCTANRITHNMEQNTHVKDVEQTKTYGVIFSLTKGQCQWIIMYLENKYCVIVFGRRTSGSYVMTLRKPCWLTCKSTCRLGHF